MNNSRSIFGLTVEKITPSIIILLVIIITVKTNVDRSNTYSVTEISQYNNSVKEYEDVYLKVDPRSKISKSLSVNNSELIMIEDRSCGVSGSLENRKRLRWVIRANELKLYKYIYQNVSNIAPYYFYIVYHSLIIFISFFSKSVIWLLISITSKPNLGIKFLLTKPQ